MLKSLPKSLASAGLAMAVSISSLVGASTEANAHDQNLHRFLGATAGILLLDSLIDRQRSHTHYAPAPVTRYVAPPPVMHYAPPPVVVVPQMVAPSSCYTRYEGPNVDVRAYGAHCMQGHVHSHAYLPDSCRESVFTYHGWREVYDAQCLYRHGWVRS